MYGNDGGSGGFRISPQLVIAVVIALFGLFKYMASSQRNPITGEKQRVALSVEQEVSLGMQSAPRMAAQMGGVVDRDDKLARLVSEVGDKLVNAGDTARGPYKFNFHLLKDRRTINAFALPGGQIFITLGLLMRLENEAQLAGVLGHEIGHVVHRHSAQHMAKGELGQVITSAVGVAGSGDHNSGANSRAVAAMVNNMVQLKYGRGDESQSDEYGFQVMAKAGYDPSQLLGVMRVLAEASKGHRQPEFLSSHPFPEHRIEQIEALLRQHYPNGVPSSLSTGKKFVRESGG